MVLHWLIALLLIAVVQSRTASSWFSYEISREALQLPRNPTARYCTKNGGLLLC